MKVLLVDDEPEIVRDMLTMFGYDVDVACDGYDGVQKFMDQTTRYEMMILDVQMPRMDGWAVLRQVRNANQKSDIPILMLTACDEEASVIMGLRRGADDYVTKPVTPGRLMAHLEALSRRANWQMKESHPSVPAILPEQQANMLTQLTPREKDILKSLVQGKSNAEIAIALTISETTVKNHLAHIFKKLQVTNRTQAAFIAQGLWSVL